MSSHPSDGLIRAASVDQSTDSWAEITLEDDMGLSGAGGESMADPAQSPTATFKRFRDVTSITEVPGSTPKGVIQWTESGGAQIVQTSDGRVLHGTLARTYFQDEGRLLGYTVYPDYVLVYESSTSQEPAAGDKEWLREAIKGTPLENKIVIVEYSCDAGKIREQIHP
ncbi:hypothetical protein [Sorangium sp. So ce1078]|uniref:hypothetical protein n=1 Tax=Sorangium sp. So ce1078 TaxID=3133329 RepID=UPI003F5FDC17